MKAIIDNYKHVRDNVENAAASVNRDATKIKIVVVTKGHKISVVQEAIDNGLRIFGENYIEEADDKISGLRNIDVEWHMIGHIQSRKAKKVIGSYSLIHSVDRLKLARRLEMFSMERNIITPILLEFNVSGESTKFGWQAWDKKMWSEIVNEVQIIMGYNNLRVRGLMTMPPWSQQGEQSRKYFVKLIAFKHYLLENVPGINLEVISMGMSDDYQVAVQEGATIIRVGTAILGPRSTAKKVS